MENNISVFLKKLSENEALQKKAAEAAKALPANASDEEIFNKVLSPLAAEMGLNLTLEECIKANEDLNVSDNELAQTSAGGIFDGLGFGGGAGVGFCDVSGWGFGLSIGNKAGMGCLIVGLGKGCIACLTAGISD